MNLPKTVLRWTRPDQPKAVTGKNIFQYMDGAGELYIGYRFDHLDVYTYQSTNRDLEDDILVELYHMKSSDDAFGLLSLDWTGEPVSLSRAVIPQTRTPLVQDVRFLYGSGLLRIWSEKLYVRIMAFPETPESREAVMQIGRAIVQERENALVPAFLNVLPPLLGPGWTLEKERISFLRSYLVLNSIYFISFSNILDLDLSCEIAAAPYRISTAEGKSQPLYVFVIRYLEPDKARRALIRFHKAYFPEILFERKTGVTFFRPNVYLTEKKWSGYALHGEFAVLGFELPDFSAGKTILTEVINYIKNMEGVYE